MTISPWLSHAGVLGSPHLVGDAQEAAVRYVKSLRGSHLASRRFLHGGGRSPTMAVNIPAGGDPALLISPPAQVPPAIWPYRTEEAIRPHVGPVRSNVQSFYPFFTPFVRFSRSTTLFKESRTLHIDQWREQRGCHHTCNLVRPLCPPPPAASPSPDPHPRGTGLRRLARPSATPQRAGRVPRRRRWGRWKRPCELPILPPEEWCSRASVVGPRKDPKG